MAKDDGRAAKAPPAKTAKAAPARSDKSAEQQDPAARAELAESTTTTAPDIVEQDPNETPPGQQQEVDVSQPQTQPGDRGVSQVSTEGQTQSTAESSGASAETTTTTAPDITPQDGDEPSQQELVAGADEPKKLSKEQRERRASLGRVSLVTVSQAVMQMQGAEGISQLQRALGLQETGYPDDTLLAAITAYRRDNDLGDGNHVDAALLQHLGFEVVTV